MNNFHLQFVESIEEIGAAQWNALTGTGNPFMRYEFLHGLEATGCTNRETGWQPCHVAVYEKASDVGTDRTPVAVAPLYLKTNSWGEYVFDWSWANAFRSHGLPYYPKFVTAAPFTPSTGQRLFISANVARESVMSLIDARIRARAEAAGVSSWHVLFPSEQEHGELDRLGVRARIATQFHFHNKDYETFEDFLAALSSRKRKTIRKERRHVFDEGIRFLRTEGADIEPAQWSEFYEFYQSTYQVRGMQAYLSQAFFATVARTMPEQILLITAVRKGQTIAAALFFRNEEALFGRYWGSHEDYRFLHFETCYYQGQDYAIEHGLKIFDAGAQGEHKLQRGFEPVTTWSNHWLAHEGFAAAIGDFLRRERPLVLRYMDEARSLLPYRKSP